MILILIENCFSRIKGELALEPSREERTGDKKGL